MEREGTKRLIVTPMKERAVSPQQYVEKMQRVDEFQMMMDKLEGEKSEFLKKPHPHELKIQGRHYSITVETEKA